MSRRDVHQPIRTADFAPHRAGKLAELLQPTRTNAFNIINNFRQFLPWLNHGLPWRWGVNYPSLRKGLRGEFGRRLPAGGFTPLLPVILSGSRATSTSLRLPSLTAVTRSLHHTTSKVFNLPPPPLYPLASQGSCKQRDDKERFGEVD